MVGCSLALGYLSLLHACYCLVHRGMKGYLWWERGSCGEGLTDVILKPVLSVRFLLVKAAERL